MHILITGSTVHARQYVESYMFDNTMTLSFFPDNNNEIAEQIKHYGIDIVSKDDIRRKINDYDITIVSNIVGQKYQILQMLDLFHYTGKYIIEKPFAKSLEYHTAKKKLLANNRYIVAYSRQLYADDIRKKIVKSDCSELWWPNFYKLGILIKRDTLPHVLDFLLIINDYYTFDTEVLEDSDEKLVFTAKLEENTVYVTIYDTENDEDKVRMGTVEFEWLSYFMFNRSMVISLDDDAFVDLNNGLNDILGSIYYRFLRRDTENE